MTGVYCGSGFSRAVRMAARAGLALLLLATVAVFDPAAAQTVRPPAGAVEQAAPVAGEVPGGALGSRSDSELWRAIRQGESFSVSIPDRNAATLVQSEGALWLNIRNGPVREYGAWGLGGIVALLLLFYLLRGRIRIEHGKAGATISRFSAIERFGHWLLAVSFVILGLTGLIMLYGRPLLIPVIGKEAFASLTAVGKLLHNYLAFAFMAGLLITFVMWVRHNFPSRHDLVWIARGGGLLVKGVHPPSRKFNAGQKLVFWIVMLLGLSLSLSGIALMFPFEFRMFSATFEVMNLVGFDLPTSLTTMQEMQLSQLWHTVVALVLVIAIIAHIYIGTLGMEGAFDAMGTGEVDLNWAREHHNLWAAEVEARRAPADGPAAAE